MKKAFRKYFVVSLSLMLILSNFSFANQLMFCEMAGDNSRCECTHNDRPDYPGINLAQEKTKCCEERTTELTNSNTLLSCNNSQEQDSHVYLTLFYVSKIDPDTINNSIFSCLPQGAYHPEIDIPVFTSSLLI